MRRAVLRRTVTPLLVAALLAAALLPPSAAPARAAQASIVFAAHQALVDRHIERPEPLKLLNAALDGLRQALVRVGVNESLQGLSATTLPAARQEFQARFDQAAAASQGKLTEAELQYAAVRAMAASIGTSHTSFMDPAQWEERQRAQRDEPSYSGIGTRSIARDGRYYFLEVFAGGPAARAGVQPLDRVLTIEGQTTEGMSQSEFSSRLRGPEATVVTITVRRAGESALVTITIVRAPIRPPVVEFSMLEGSVGYLRFRQFLGGSSGQVRRALESLQRQGMRGLALDLRGNPGGLITELRNIASLLLPPGLPIAIREDREGHSITDVTAGDPVLPSSVPLVVIVDDGAASASELLSAAIQEHRRGTLVGVRTRGAVLNSTDVRLPGGTAIQVPIRRVKTGGGVVLEGHGVRPDLVSVLTADDLDRGVDAQVQRAIQLAGQRAAIRALPGQAVGWWQVLQERLPRLHGSPAGVRPNAAAP